MPRLHRRTALAATALATLLWTPARLGRHDAAERVLRSDRELYQDFNKAFAEHWKAEDRRDGDHPGSRMAARASRPAP